MYDYLVVGSGLYGSIFAREAANKGYKVLVVDKRNNVGGNIYQKRWKVLISTSMEPTFSTRIIQRFGIISSSMQNLIVLRIVRWLIIRASFIPFHSICTHSIRCEEL